MNPQIKVLLGQSSMLSLELAYKAIKEMVPFKLIDEFEAETGPFIGYPRGEFAISSAGVTLLKEWLTRLEQIELGIDRIKLQDNPNALVPATEGGIVPKIDEWLRATSPLSPTYKTELASLLKELDSWLESFGDFDELIGELAVLIRTISKATVPTSLAKSKTESFLQQVFEIYADLQTKVPSKKETALASGSTFDEMEAYIEELVANKQIKASREKELLDLYHNQKHAVVGLILLRRELKAKHG